MGLEYPLVAGNPAVTRQFYRVIKSKIQITPLFLTDRNSTMFTLFIVILNLSILFDRSEKILQIYLFTTIYIDS